MSRMPPDRALHIQRVWGLFALPDGCKISVDPGAVTAIYDHPTEQIGGGPMCVIAIGHTNLLVPYTHDEVMAILYGNT